MGRGADPQAAENDGILNLNRRLAARWHTLDVRTKKILKRSGQFALAVLPFVWIFSRFSLESFRHTLTTTASWTLPSVVVAVLLCMFLHGFRWWLLLRVSGASISLGKALRFQFVGSYYSLILPTSAAQDVVRGFLAAKEVGHDRSWSATFVAKIAGLLALLLLSVYGFATIGFTYDRRMSVAAAVFATVLLVSITLSFSKGVTRPIRRVLSLLLPSKAMQALESFREGVYQFRNSGGTLALVLLLSVVVQLVVVVSPILIVKGITGRFYPGELFAFVPVIELLTTIVPLTPSGLGIREGLYALLFMRMGLSESQLGVFAVFSLLSTMMKVVGVVPILCDWILNRTRRDGLWHTTTTSPERD